MTKIHLPRKQTPNVTWSHMLVFPESKPLQVGAGHLAFRLLQQGPKAAPPPFSQFTELTFNSESRKCSC